MKPRHGAVSVSLLTVAGLLGLGTAGLSVVTGVTPCSIMKACTTDVAAPVAATVCDTPKAENEVTLVSATTEGTCSDPSKAVAVSDSECSDTAASCEDEAAAVTLVGAGDKGSCSDEAKAVAVGDSDCKTACEDDAAITLVAAGGKSDGKGTCGDEAKAIVVGDTECSTTKGCEEKAVVATTVGDAKECSSCEDAPAALPVASAAFNTACPYSGKDIDAAFTSSYNGMKVDFCCKGCLAKFNKADEAEQASLVANVVTPINADGTCCDKPVDASTMVVSNGFPVAFCSEKCANSFGDASAKEQAAHVASITKPVNETCPMSGKPINASIVAFHNGKAVGFCGKGCAKNFNASSDSDKSAVLAKFAADNTECGDDCEKKCCKADA